MARPQGATIVQEELGGEVSPLASAAAASCATPLSGGPTPPATPPIRWDLAATALEAARRRLTVLVLWQAGVSPTQIAGRVELSLSRIHQMLKRARVDHLATELAARGASVEEVAARLRISPTRVWCAIQAAASPDIPPSTPEAVGALDRCRTPRRSLRSRPVPATETRPPDPRRPPAGVVHELARLEEEDPVVCLSQAGCSVDDIAYALGFSVHRVRSRLHAYARLLRRAHRVPSVPAASTTR